MTAVGRRTLVAGALVMALLGIAGCGGTAGDRMPTVFDRDPEIGDQLPGALSAGFDDSRLVNSWSGADVYLATRSEGDGLCLVIVRRDDAAEPAASGCTDRPPIEVGLQGAGWFRYSLDQPDRDEGWQMIGPDVYARL